jgi:hypothetical protein
MGVFLCFKPTNVVLKIFLYKYLAFYQLGCIIVSIRR